MLMYASVGEWRSWLRSTLFAESLIGVVRNLYGASADDDARSMVASWPDTMPMHDVYELLQAGCRPATLVDKTYVHYHRPCLMSASCLPARV